MKKRSHPLGARIKRLMQADDDVGKIASATPNLIGRAVELFLQKLCQSTLSVAQSRQAKTLTPAHLKAFVHSDNLMDFLKDTVSSAPDLGIDTEAAAGPKLKRQRTVEPPDAPSLPSVRGRGRGPPRQPRGRVPPSRTSGTTDSDSDLSDSPSHSPSAHTMPPASHTNPGLHPSHRTSSFHPHAAPSTSAPYGTDPQEMHLHQNSPRNPQSLQIASHPLQQKSSLLSSLPSARGRTHGTTAPDTHPLPNSAASRSKLGQHPPDHGQTYPSSSHHSRPQHHHSAHVSHPEPAAAPSAVPAVPAPVPGDDAEGSSEKMAPLPVQVSASALTGYQGGFSHNEDYDDDYDDDYDN